MKARKIRQIDLIEKEHRIEVLNIKNCKHKRKVKLCCTCIRFYECVDLLIAITHITKKELVELSKYKGSRKNKAKQLAKLLEEIISYKDSV